MTALRIGDLVPRISADAWVAPTATVVGDVAIEPGATVFYGAVVRGDRATIRLGRGSNLQDNVVVHADPDFPTTIGSDVTVGHAAVLHGCTIEDGALIGIGAIVLNGAVIGSGSLVGAGALVSPGTVIPPRSLVLGAPGKVRRELTGNEVEANLENSRRYAELIPVHRSALDAAG